ncbi:hypothetical protein KM043_000048, partial [Ampulex compressa]
GRLGQKVEQESKNSGTDQGPTVVFLPLPKPPADLPTRLPSLSLPLGPFAPAWLSVRSDRPSGQVREGRARAAGRRANGDGTDLKQHGRRPDPKARPTEKECAGVKRERRPTERGN